jgi:predicted DNA-binding protein
MMDSQLFDELVNSIIEAGAIKRQEILASRVILTEAIREQLEDLDDLNLAEQRYAEVKAGQSETISLIDVMKRYGLDH